MTPHELVLGAIRAEWGRGSPTSQPERLAVAVVVALSYADFLKIDCQANNPVVRRGRPRVIPAEIRERIQSEHQAGSTFNAIAKRLNEEGVPAATGRWHHGSVAKIARESPL